MDDILVNKKGNIAEIVLNRPEKYNSIRFQTMLELEAALKEAEENDDVRVVILKGAGNIFSSGADLNALLGFMSDPAEIARQSTQLNKTFNAIEDCSKPVIGAVRGFALAGGLELLLCCDLIVAEENARIGDQHANFGLIPGGGGSQRLTRALGPRLAKYLLFTGSWLSGRDAEKLGLINKAVPAEELDKTVDELALNIAAKSPKGIQELKKLVHDGLKMPLHESIEYEAGVFLKHLMTCPDVTEGVTAFNEKRKPKF